jgi:hypothetical protein
MKSGSARETGRGLGTSGDARAGPESNEAGCVSSCPARRLPPLPRVLSWLSAAANRGGHGRSAICYLAPAALAGLEGT